MKIIVMGCGRVGEQVSRLMAEEGHRVSVVDYDPNALARMGSGFKGQLILGVGFDRKVLISAGIEHADAFAATSSSDNVNIIAARIARNIFHVPRVVARLFDPRRAEIYQRLGLLTISSTTWGAERIRELLSHQDLDATATFGDGEVSMIALETPAQVVGMTVKNLTVPGEITVAVITRQGKAFVPLLGTEFLHGDVVHFVVQASAMDRFKSLYGLIEGGL